MTELAQITDHAEQALAQLITQYQDKPDLEQWVRSYARETQELEDVFWSLITERTVDSATGDLLRKLGKIVLQPYRGEPDDIYRKLVIAKIAVNRSHGQWRDLRSVAGILFTDVAKTLRVSGLLSLELRINDALGARPWQEQALLEAAAQSGTRVDLTYWVDADEDDNRFAFGDEGGGFEDSGLPGAVSSWVQL